MYNVEIKVFPYEISITIIEISPEYFEFHTFSNFRSIEHKILFSALI